MTTFCFGVFKFNLSMLYKIKVVHFTALSLNQINRYNENHQQLLSVACCTNKEKNCFKFSFIVWKNWHTPSLLHPFFCAFSLAPFLLRLFSCTLSFAPFLLHPFLFLCSPLKKIWDIKIFPFTSNFAYEAESLKWYKTEPTHTILPLWLFIQTYLWTLYFRVL